MEIIKHGKKYDPTKIYCERCDCVYQYSDVDIKECDGFGQTEGVQLLATAFYVRCPECGNKHNLNMEMAKKMNCIAVNDLIDKFSSDITEDKNNICVHFFLQTWESTALGFGGFGGQAMTSAMTIVLYSHQLDLAWVAWDGVFAYEIKEPNQSFFEDMAQKRMAPVDKIEKYLKKKEEI